MAIFNSYVSLPEGMYDDVISEMSKNHEQFKGGPIRGQYWPILQFLAKKENNLLADQ